MSFSSVQFIDSMPQLNDKMTEQICRQWKRTKRHQSALTIALTLTIIYPRPVSLAILPATARQETGSHTYSTLQPPLDVGQGNIT